LLPTTDQTLIVATRINRPSNQVAQWEHLRSRWTLGQASGERVFGLGPATMAENDDDIVRSARHQRKGDEGGA
jgi:uncharacterized membrane protein YesL